MVKRVTRKPVIYWAIQYTGGNLNEINEFCGKDGLLVNLNMDDWIVKEITGVNKPEYHFYDDKTFQKLYEKVNIETPAFAGEGNKS